MPRKIPPRLLFVALRRQPEIGGRSEVDFHNNRSKIVGFLCHRQYHFWRNQAMTRRDYERKFSTFPDVVTLNEFRAMLGGIADGTARKLLRENHVEHFYIRTTYYIPKEKVIDYLLSDHYMKYRFKLKHGIR